MASAIRPSGCDRTKKRSRVLMVGTLFTPDGAQKVRVRDISATGAQIVAESSVTQDCDAIFKRGAIFAAARVAWSKGRWAGLTFYRELPAADVRSGFIAGDVAA